MGNQSALAERQVIDVAKIGYARGKVGQRNRLTTTKQKAEFKNDLARRTLPLTIVNTADCGDERLTIALANGTQDSQVLQRRIVRQLFGGIGLALTKALVAADAVAVKDARDMWDAFIKTDALLTALGYRNAGHADCGASAGVQSSVANPIDFDLLVPSVGLFVPDQGYNEGILQKIGDHKQALLDRGFYDNWDPQKHANFLIEHYPDNFSYLQVDPHDHETHGHNGSGLYVITQDGVGFQKSGRAFSLTLPLMYQLATQTGGSLEERQRILLGLVDDSLHVGAGLVAADFPVFAQAA